MEMYFFRRDLYEKLHNCNYFDIDSIPLPERRHVAVGCVLMVLASVLELLYIPCLISLHRHANNACYKIMRYIAVLDLLIIPVNGILTGYFAVQGYVFCSSPTFIYMVGAVVLGLYCAVCMASVILAVNRVIEMVHPNWNEILFTPRLVICWLVFSSIYGLYFIIFTAPLKFTAIYCTWPFHPFTGYSNEYAEFYLNPVHTFNNAFESCSLIFLYSTFFIILMVRSCDSSTTTTSNNTAKRRSQIRSFFQVFLISAVSLVSCTIYVSENFFELSVYVTILGQFAWLFMHGLPPLIYLTLNNTIRRDTIKMLRLDKLCVSGVIKPIKSTNGNPSASDLHVQEKHDSSKNTTVTAVI